ncbi:receptor-like protein 6 [Humulus lupulus]|uniref:receptor-like protein 6 n=1 Tax=Humulus lupulus TaxID=3486 RepID=UPI002B40EB1A|nr:receptor-like protein 6 [Humulus lupulus]
MEYWSSCLMFLLTLVLLLSQSLIDSSTPSPSNNFLCHPAESSALLQFINSFIINPKTVSWKNGTDCCLWDGVSCDHISGHVIGLDLSSGGLQGPLHSNSALFSLIHLQTLILDFNDFSCSPIPPEIGSFANMKTLSLFFANFSGYIPEEISHLSKLSHLTIFGNIDDCHFLMGPFVLKKMLQNFTNLMELTMNNIDMSGVELVSSFMNVSSSLTTLDLYQCGLRGKFPENVFRLPNLQELRLGINPYSPFSGNLTGSLPMFNWSSPLWYLDLSDTKISIDLPYMCSSAKSLQILFLSNCSFKGSSNSAMLTNLTQLVELSVLVINSNNFGGHIPLFFLNLQQLTILYLSGNNFVGKIPEFPKANSSQSPLQLNLEQLIISDNLLSESIPSWVYSLPHLKYLGLNNNKLIGPIKEFHSKSLVWLNLGSNKLHGQIPNSIFQQKNLGNINLSHNSLDGVLELSKFSMLKNLRRLDLSFNNFTVSTNKYSNNDSFPQLFYLGLASCNISEFPYFLRNMKSLVIVDLRSNMIEGPLPTVPPSMSIFFISNNALSGEIPSTYCNLSELEILDVSNNSIHGKIPSCLGNKFSLSVLDLHTNNFWGEIPHDMFEKLTNLRSLHLSNNHLDGSLPRSLRSCQSLEVLDVGNNKINDTFPHWLEDLPMLRVLV